MGDDLVSLSLKTLSFLNFQLFFFLFQLAANCC